MTYFILFHNPLARHPESHRDEGSPTVRHQATFRKSLGALHLGMTCGVTLLLTGCATAPTPHTTATHDGAPKHPKALHYKKVQPQSEPMSRYGNPESYKVNGQYYEVMPDAKGYKKRGIASWYGTQFHKQRTSSGEKYNMYDMTAAHRTLPIPSYIKIKNLNNQRETIVRINDRGPFHANRLVDLSYAAARYLGLIPQGTAPVEIQALTLRKTPAHYYLQAAAFQSKQLANNLRAKLPHIGNTPVKVELHNKQYVVSIGPFLNRTALNTYKRKLNTLGLNHTIAYLQ